MPMDNAEKVEKVPDKELLEIVKGYLLLRNTNPKVQQITITRDTTKKDTWNIEVN